MKQQQSALEQMQARTQKVINEREAEIRALEAGKVQLDARLGALARKMTAAGASGDINAYSEAAGEQAKVKAAQDATALRLDVLRNEPAISAEDYKSLNDLVRSEYMGHYRERKERLNKLLTDMQVIQGEEDAERAETNKALLAWQRDVYRRADVPDNLRNLNGVNDNRLKDREIYGFLNRLFGSAEYGALMGERDE